MTRNKYLETELSFVFGGGPYHSDQPDAGPQIFESVAESLQYYLFKQNCVFQEYGIVRTYIARVLYVH